MPAASSNPDHDGQVIHREPGTLTRRELLVGFAASVAAGVLGNALAPAEDDSHEVSDVAGTQHPDDELSDTDQTHHEGSADTHETEEGHEGISAVNWITALPVAGMFANVVKHNMGPLEVGGRQIGEVAQEFGLNSFLKMASVEVPRLAVLAVGDKHQFEHEGKDILISYGLMGVLTTAAEATEHAEVDEEAMFESVKTLGDKLDDDLAVEMPERDAGPEKWAEYLKAKQRQVAEVAAQNFALSAILAPTATTYTSAAITSVAVGRMAGHVAELEYAKLMKDSASRGVVSEASAEELMEQATEIADKAINGKSGYSNLLLTLAGNVQGAGFIGDPPNWFYALRNGPAAWIEMSKEGLVKANILAASETTQWLASNVGLGDGVAVTAFRQTGIKAFETVKGMISSSRHLDASVCKNRRFAANLHEALANANRAGVMSPESRDEILAMMETMPRSPFVYDVRGVEQAFSGINKLTERDKSTVTSAARELKHAEDPNLAEFRELIESSSDHTVLIRNMLTSYAEHSNAHASSEVMAKFLTALLNGEEIEEADLEAIAGTNFAEKGQTERLDLDDPEIENLAAELDEAIQADDNEEIARILDSIDEKLIFLPQDTRKAVRFAWAEAINADVVDHKLKENKGFSHSSSEVFHALRTQILAANAIAVLAKKALEEAPEFVTVEQKSAAVLAMAGGISGVADNVVAYIFAEDVLSELYEGEYGKEAMETAAGVELNDRLTRSALFIAIAGGSLTKIGNGPNFKFKRKHPVVEDGRITVKTEDIDFADSVANLYSWEAYTATLVDSIWGIHGVNAKLKAEVEQAA